MLSFFFFCMFFFCARDRKSGPGLYFHERRCFHTARHSISNRMDVKTAVQTMSQTQLLDEVSSLVQKVGVDEDL